MAPRLLCTVRLRGAEVDLTVGSAGIIERPNSPSGDGNLGETCFQDENIGSRVLVSYMDMSRRLLGSDVI